MRWSRLLAGTIALLGIVCALVALKPWSPSSPRRAPSPDAQLLATIQQHDAQSLRAANPDPASTVDPDALAATIATFRDTLRSAFADHPVDVDLAPRDIDAIVGLACERLELLVNPDYDAYVQHVRWITGFPVGSAQLTDRLMAREEWERYARGYAGCAVDPTKAEVRAVFVGGDAVEGALLAGHLRTAQNGVHPFMDLRFELPRLDKPADVVDVRVPIDAKDADSGKPITVFFVVRLARLTPVSPWVPWLVSVNDPSDRGYVHPPPL